MIADEPIYSITSKITTTKKSFRSTSYSVPRRSWILLYFQGVSQLFSAKPELNGTSTRQAIVWGNGGSRPTGADHPRTLQEEHFQCVFSRLNPKSSRISKASLKSQSVAVLGMRNGTSQSPFRPALGRQLVRAADAPLRGHGFGTSRLRQTPTTNGLTAYRMRLHLACVSSGTYGPFATSASRSRLRLPRTTRLALRASLAGSGRHERASGIQDIRCPPPHHREGGDRRRKARRRDHYRGRRLVPHFT